MRAWWTSTVRSAWARKSRSRSRNPTRLGLAIEKTLISKAINREPKPHRGLHNFFDALIKNSSLPPISHRRLFRSPFQGIFSRFSSSEHQDPDLDCFCYFDSIVSSSRSRRITRFFPLIRALICVFPFDEFTAMRLFMEVTPNYADLYAPSRMICFSLPDVQLCDLGLGS
ncbi:uncharacterized protein J3R85_002210 [Psidium guajava]|nr:uncharacterized protein J3R85_002210 [Psidium guajava]